MVAGSGESGPCGRRCLVPARGNSVPGRPRCGIAPGTDGLCGHFGSANPRGHHSHHGRLDQGRPLHPVRIVLRVRHRRATPRDRPARGKPSNHRQTPGSTRLLRPKTPPRHPRHHPGQPPLLPHLRPQNPTLPRRLAPRRRFRPRRRAPASARHHEPPQKHPRPDRPKTPRQHPVRSARLLRRISGNARRAPTRRHSLQNVGRRWQTAGLSGVDCERGRCDYAGAAGQDQVDPRGGVGRCGDGGLFGFDAFGCGGSDRGGAEQ
uniref:(northern house mosquito) hypothetical protein n=1 Tax=Culex pipiens TaxID=7175 RepID=A0A8D8KXP2_CULPI